MNTPFIPKALVTGANGFIGRTLVDFLVKNGSEVIAVDRSGLKNSDCKCVVLDVTERGALDHYLDEETIIFHLAARANVAESVRDPRGDFTNSLQSFFEVIESSRIANCQLIFPSSASMCDSLNGLPLAEDVSLKPTSPYAATKMACEAYCHAYFRSYGLNVKIVRLFSVYGPGMFQFAIHDMIKKLQKNPVKLEILGDGNQIRDYLFVDDAAAGLAKVAVFGKPGEVYNLAGGVPVKIDDLAKQIATLMGKTDVIIEPTGRSFPGDVSKWYGDISKIKEIGFSTTVSLDEGLKRTIYWLLNNN